MENFEPRIIAFICKWCTSSAADLAGTARIQYPHNVRIVRLMCTGSIDPVYIYKAFLDGADGILIGGCHPGDCHYVSGNLKARRRATLLKSIMTSLGLEEERIWLRWIGADEGRKFAGTVSEMVEAIKKLGPNAMRSKVEV